MGLLRNIVTSLMPSAFIAPVYLPPSSVPLPSYQRSRCSHSQPRMSDDQLFATRCIDKLNSQSIRAENRAAHLEWAATPSANIVFAGPLRHSQGDPVHGSLIIMRAPSAQVAKERLLEDPYYTARLFESVCTRRWVMGMASDELPDQLFVVWCVDNKESLQLRKETRPRHLDWWRAAGRRGIIGPFPCDGGANGSLIVCEGESVEEVAQWATTDPYNQVGLFDVVHVSSIQNVVDRISKSKTISA